MMEHQFLSIEQLDQQLKQWNGKHIKIEKIELTDKDEIHMNLTDIAYESHTRRLDQYEAMHTLILNGEGEIQSSQGYQPLPDASYEIPLEDTSLYEFDGEQFLLTTDRGVYRISLES
ncbi:hypothetical protein [Virgibacillus sp. MG-45]|uniref:hypothetical protein n=1 Tax=Virgibacillus sp. MG-45 TaxID=3102791 RepID=UPI002ED9387D